MSLAGFKKQLNKANQLLSERIAGAKGTELDSDFLEMERKIEVANKMVDELITKTQEYLQPNPMARVRLSAAKGFNNLQNKSRNIAYPQPEGILGDCMLKHGKDLGQDSCLGEALVESGEAYKQMAEIKYSLEDSVKQNFLDPFTAMQQRDLKEINHHLKKLEGRRLDYDCKKRKAGGSKPNEDELHAAEDKFSESKTLAENAMVNFLNSDAEHVSAMYELVSAELVYHQEACRILSNLQTRLETKRSEAASRPKSEHVPFRPVVRGASKSSSINSDQSGAGATGGGARLGGAMGGGGAVGGNGGDPWRLSASDKFQEPAGPAVSVKPRTQAKSGTPTCRALFTFTAENSTELAFEEGDVIQLVAQVDENWFEGELKGRRGFFPVNYVDVIVPLP